MKSKWKYRIRTVQKPGKSKRFYPEFIAVNDWGLDFDDWQKFIYEKDDKKVYFKSEKKAKKFLDKEILQDIDYTISVQDYPYSGKMPNFPINITSN